ncbi:GTPase family protein [Escherichia coli]|nr:GTPase family protein [Escherichia coli]EFL0397835.1 GTPase family protein [Escherichia coli]
MNPSDAIEAIEKPLSSLPYSLSRHILEHLRKLTSHEPVIGIMGKSGAGKSSLCNALFQGEVTPVSDVHAGTREVRRFRLSGHGHSMVITDLPGVGESRDRDAEYEALYRDILPELDLVLWLIKADDRALSVDEYFWRHILHRGHQQVLFVVTQADKTEPCHEWDMAGIQPSPAQAQNIREKTEAVFRLFRPVHPVVAVSARTGWELDTLVSALMTALPDHAASPLMTRLQDELRTESVRSQARDQYAGAVETMRNKIREGKVPGVTDPAEASRLIRRGHLTYTQARNITRFGTIESVTYDIAEGSVVSLAAGGISFALTASVFWLSTGDRDAALQTAAVQAGKTFTRTLAVYVTTQQLHRLSVVQGMLKHIDFSTASPTVRLALQKGTGAGNISALNKVMKGTLVTSLALVAVTTGPDMIKMLRGRISGTQFIRNLAVASSGVAGGAVGSVAGGILFSPLGPFGALTGRVVGGVLGGMIASAVSGKIAGALVEEDRVKILAMIQEQVTWLAGSFLLTGHEIENLNENLARVIDQNALEIIFAAGIQQRAATNMLIKPLVVSIIRQRPVMEYDASHLGNMVNRLEEALPPELPA